MKYPVALTCGALWLASVSSLAWAADVPPGTVLAEKQLFTAQTLDGQGKALAKQNISFVSAPYQR